jgi:PAP2 superfamily
MTIVLDTLTKREATPAPPSGALGFGLGREQRAAARELLHSLRQHSLLIATVVVYCVVGRHVPVWFDVSGAYPDHVYTGLFFAMAGIAAVLFAIAYTVHLRLVVKPRDFFGTLGRDLFGRFLTLRRLCIVLPLFLLIPFFGATFTNLKILIPVIQPFSWDPTFAEWDRLLHFGRYPWEWLQPVLGYPYVTSLINAVYHSWFFLTYGVFLWQIVDTSRPRLRMQYLLTFLLAWALIGNAAAMFLSSGGPVYFGRITGLPDPFAPLMDYLHHAAYVAPVPALGVQEMLWSTYAARGLAVGGGISAMPSLHVAIAFSFVLLGAAIDRRLAWAATLFTALILVGSVHLGWHYAIDGYVSIPLTWLIWRITGWLLDRPSVARVLTLETESLPSRGFVSARVGTGS